MAKMDTFPKYLFKWSVVIGHWSLVNSQQSYLIVLSHAWLVNLDYAEVEFRLRSTPAQ
ncbi:hypothetical protein [Nostoc sp. NIES-3756]|uniref:hypothetical protein n=1 Tax=Nostoc sp. NIES-3756 TaxID=1751286 RepID=UPI000AD48B33|nr:hypothetical protein [Nostoc sp. NIES-3756]